jgi:hypothetical protein
MTEVLYTSAVELEQLTEAANRKVRKSAKTVAVDQTALLHLVMDNFKLRGIAGSRAVLPDEQQRAS